MHKSIISLIFILSFSFMSTAQESCGPLLSATITQEALIQRASEVEKYLERQIMNQDPFISGPAAEKYTQLQSLIDRLLSVQPSDKKQLASIAQNINQLLKISTEEEPQATIQKPMTWEDLMADSSLIQANISYPVDTVSGRSINVNITQEIVELY
ncbi:MAG: hypothetical protein KDD34_10145, partial [Bdellovibrionales bacterium]|nr:hypothetical protein [Bdellovibrionales bacterium]